MQDYLNAYLEYRQIVLEKWKVTFYRNNKIWPQLICDLNTHWLRSANSTFLANWNWDNIYQKIVNKVKDNDQI